ncbi:MAG: hypothetical protein FRX48_02221 [Lasallia pustulata]|uniref:Beta-lactamase-like n=1 Tax=Lasallia pustulata TaxID=136370 RepID=A0A5M8PXU0_9LECA|nr:MAG: hypothetical protein FRX48_02221 [Lasallia pustulata]
MTSKLIPSDPSSVMVIRQITPNIVSCSAPFARFGRFKVGGRGTIVRLQSGAIAVFSPIALTPDVRATLQKLGNNVRYLSALDFEHHIFISDWAKAFPDAKLLGPEGLSEKREKSQETAGTKFQHIWTQKNKTEIQVDPDFDREFDYEYVGSHGNKEVVFFHKPDRTLIEADLMFNLPATEQYSKTREGATSGILTKLFVGLMSAEGKALWQKRFLWYVASAQDRPGFNQSIRKIDSWDFQRIIPCHGDVIENGAKGIFRKVFEWHLNAAAK